MSDRTLPIRPTRLLALDLLPTLTRRHAEPRAARCHRRGRSDGPDRAHPNEDRRAARQFRVPHESIKRVTDYITALMRECNSLGSDRRSSARYNSNVASTSGNSKARDRYAVEIESATVFPTTSHHDRRQHLTSMSQSRETTKFVKARLGEKRSGETAWRSTLGPRARWCGGLAKQEAARRVLRSLNLDEDSSYGTDSHECKPYHATLYPGAQIGKNRGDESGTAIKRRKGTLSMLSHQLELIGTRYDLPDSQAVDQTPICLATLNSKPPQTQQRAIIIRTEKKPKRHRPKTPGPLRRYLDEVWRFRGAISSEKYKVSGVCN